MERRQNQTALCMMHFTFTGEQAITQDALCLLQGAALGEIRILSHQYIAYVIRVIRKEHLPVQDLESGEVSVAVCEVLQKCERVPSKSKECDIDETARSRRVDCLRGR
jgi:hypothetical protein